jgi:hypothetical protein
VKTIAALIMVAWLALVTSAHALPVTQGKILIVNAEGMTDFDFVIILGESGHHAFVWDLVNGYASERPQYDWIPLGDYTCLAGQRCLVGGAGVQLIDFWAVPVTAPTIDFWGRPLAAAVPEPDVLPMMVMGLIWLAALTAVLVKARRG